LQYIYFVDRYNSSVKVDYYWMVAAMDRVV